MWSPNSKMWSSGSQNVESNFPLNLTESGSSSGLETRQQFHELGYGRKHNFVFFSSSSSNTNQDSTQYSTLILIKHNKQP